MTWPVNIGESMRRNVQRGFTLIELMIAVVVVAILTSVAVPSYLGQIKKSRRADAMAALLGLTHFMEKTYSENNTFKPGGIDPTLPTPINGVAQYYDLTISASSATSYTLQAAPISGKAQASDGKIEIDNTGAKRWDADNNGTFEAAESKWQ
jgi:type IV pilus assembly protein PilE